jgi:hypothetical protein
MQLLRQLKLMPWAELVDDNAQQLAYSLIKKIQASDDVGAESLLTQSADENRERLVYGFSLSSGSLEHAKGWVARKPQSAFAHTVLGATLIQEGWRIRGCNYADDVADKNWAPFLEKLGEAQNALQRACELDSQFADAYAWMIHAGVGSGEENAQLKTWFDAAVAREPLHWGAHDKYFMSVTEKWGGCHKEMFAFARASAQKGGKKSPLNTLLPMAYAELALAESSRKNIKAAEAKLRHSSYAKELTLALYQWLGCKPDQLEECLLDVSGPFRGPALNHFAATLYLTGAKNEARAVCQALNGQIEQMPWAWLARGPRERLATGFVFDRACRKLHVPYKRA